MESYDFALKTSRRLPLLQKRCFQTQQPLGGTLTYFRSITALLKGVGKDISKSNNTSDDLGYKCLQQRSSIK